MPRIPIHDHSHPDSGGPLRSPIGRSTGISTGGGGAGGSPSGLESISDGTTVATGVSTITVPLGGVTSTGTLRFLTPTYGGQETVDTIAVSGATRTVDLADGNVADLTLSEACALTLDGFVNGVSSSGVVIVRPSGYALTFTDDIAWLNGVVPTLSTTEDYALVFWSFDGGTTIGGTLVNSASAVTGRWEVVVSGSAPPVAVSTPSDDDWVYAWVED